MKSSWFGVLLVLAARAEAMPAEFPDAGSAAVAEESAGAASAPAIAAPPAVASQPVVSEWWFPTLEEWDALVARLQAALNGDDPQELAACEPQVRAALKAWRALPGYERQAGWLQERLDYIEAVGQMTRQPPASSEGLPYYEVWLRRLRARPAPARATELMPRLREIFAAAGVPADLAWLAEVESTFDPEALSPVGARGLFQLMPGTARELGLEVGPADDRADPEKNAAAAARYLRRLHARFGDWELALAAYNAGPGRVSRTLRWRRARTFADIAALLPVETGMYVPKVLATMVVRTGRPLQEQVIAQD